MFDAKTQFVFPVPRTLRRTHRFPSVSLPGALLFLFIAGCAQNVSYQSSHDAQRCTNSDIATDSANGSVSDSELHKRLQTELIALQEEGKTPTQAILESQLDRSSCRLSLIEPASVPLRLSEIYNLRKKSVVILGKLYKCSQCSKWHCSTASGFIIATNGAVVTNYHVIKPGEDGYELLAVMTEDEKIYRVTEVLAADSKNDIAILKVASDRDFPALPLASDDAPVGTPVALISHPGRHFYALTSGIVSRHLLLHNRERLEITADFAKGSSGAPVLDSAGNVIAIVRDTNSIYYKTEHGNKTNLQMVIKTCIPVTALQELIPQDK